MFLSAEAILAAQDLTPVTVAVPEWGGDVMVRALSGTEGEEWSASATKRVPKSGGGWDDVTDIVGMKAKLLVKSIVDEAGNRLFTDDQIKALGAKNGAVLNRLFEKVTEMSGIGDEAKEAIEGESGAVPSDGSPSSSPES